MNFRVVLSETTALAAPLGRRDGPQGEAVLCEGVECAAAQESLRVSLQVAVILWISRSEISALKPWRKGQVPLWTPKPLSHARTIECREASFRACLCSLLRLLWLSLVR